MSVPLIAKLDELKNSGNLLTSLESSINLTEFLPLLGYSKGVKKYIPIIRKYLEDNNIDYTSLLGKNNKVTKVCPVCSKEWVVNKTNSKDMAKVTCSRACCNTHLRSGENNPNWKGGTRQHYREKAIKEYGSACQMCGFSNPFSIEVHHIDEDRTNNELDNLIVLCANCHLIAHEGNSVLKHGY